MNKAELKKKWSKYCDTDILVDTMRGLLTKHEHRNSEHGVCTMLDEYFTNKRELIDMLITSPDYIGNMRIAVDIELERTNNKREIANFCRNFSTEMNLREFIVKMTDENGKTASDYASTGVKAFNAKDLFGNNADVEKFIANARNKNKFNEYGEYIKSCDEFSGLNGLFYYGFGSNPQSVISSDTIYRAENLPKPVKLPEGMKTSRAFNKVCTEYGINKANPHVAVDNHGNVKTVYPYDKLFAEYSDMVSCTKRKLKFFISVNPLDYLTMSFGVSWKSCHSIKKPHGGWCGGCVSYMLDSTSIITYVHTEIPTDCEEGKIYREMFHYNKGAVLQSRIYPQENDGATNLYDEFWKVFAKAFSPIVGVSESGWTKRPGDYTPYVSSKGVQYPDYTNYYNYSFRYATEIDGACARNIPIGSTRICAYCGKKTDEFYKNALSHSGCKI